MNANKKIEEATLQKDRFSLKEQTYISKISKLEEENRADSREREEKYFSMIDNLKSKQKIVLGDRDGEINDLNKHYSEYYNQNEKNKSENERLRTEIAKVEKAIRESKQEIDKKCDDYERRLKMANEDKDETQRRLENDNLQLKSEIDTMNYDGITQSQNVRDLEAKCSMFKNDFDKLAEDHRRTKENYRVSREDKENAELECNRLKQLYNTKMQDLQKKIDQHNDDDREKTYAIQGEKDKLLRVIQNLENLNEKWKDEHRSTVEYFTKLVMSLNQENQQYKDQNLEYKKELRRGGKDSYTDTKPSKMTKSKSRERVK
jgi:hypothetical protein